MEFGLDILNHKFYMDAETNVPTWFNTALLLVISAISWCIGVSKLARRESYRYHWLGLGVLFLLMSIDEAAAFHEMLITPMRQWLGLGNWFYFGWVVPGLALIAVLALAYVRFFLHLDRGISLLLLASLLIYFSGAIGAEMLSGHLASAIGQRTFRYAVIASLEESVEMIGASMVIYSLLRYVRLHARWLQFEVLAV
jgi:hypothetical protein